MQTIEQKIEQTNWSNMYNNVTCTQAQIKQYQNELTENLTMFNEVSRYAKIFKCSITIQILSIIFNSKQKICVCDITKKITWWWQSAVSQHLWELLDLWFVNRQKEWNSVYYTLKDDSFREYLKNVFENNWFVEIAAFAKILRSPIRDSIAFQLLKHKKLCVGDLCKIIWWVKPSDISQHITKLANKKLVTYERDANRKYYSLSSEKFVSYLKLIYKNCTH